MLKPQLPWEVSGFLWGYVGTMLRCDTGSSHQQKRSRALTWSQSHQHLTRGLLIYRTRRTTWCRTTQFTIFPYNSRKLPAPVNSFVGLFLLSCSDIQNSKSKMLSIKSYNFSYKKLVALLFWKLPLKEREWYFSPLRRKEGIKGESRGPTSLCHLYDNDWQILS